MSVRVCVELRRIALGGVSCGEVRESQGRALIISTLKTHFNYNLQPADEGCSHRSNHSCGVLMEKIFSGWFPGWLSPVAEPNTSLAHCAPGRN